MAAATSLPHGSVAVVLGTRPEMVKLAGMIRLLGPAARVIHTGQHYDATMSDVFIAELDIPAPQTHLGVGGADRGTQIGEATRLLAATFAADRPAAVVVQGDTNAVVAGALAANAAGIPLVHVEAGLRSYDRRMPEEHNRVVADHLADLCCAPTGVNVANLAAEGIEGDRVVRTGNPVVEAVLGLLPDEAARKAVLVRHGVDASGFVLATLHRPENVDAPDRLRVVLEQLDGLGVPVVLPLHPRTRRRVAEFGLEDALDPLIVTEPLGYRDFLGLFSEAALLVSDSGGIQEEASVLKRPVVVVRRSTERPEVQGTFAELIPPGPGIGETARHWLDDLATTHERLAALPSPYGDGTASAQCVEALISLIGTAS